MEKFYTVATLAQELEISERSIHRFLAEGQLSHYRFGNRIKITEKHVNEFLVRSEHRAI